MNDSNVASAALRAGLVFGGIALAALAAQRLRTRGLDRQAPPLDDGIGPVSIDAGVLVIPSVPPLDAPDPAPGLLERAQTAVVDAVLAVKRSLLPRGMRNNNPGNIRTLPKGRAWNGQVGDDAGYGIYSEMPLGVRALGKQLLAYQKRGLVTVRDIIGTWAPPSENVTSAYVTAVARALAVKPEERIDVGARLVELAAAIIRHENGAAFETYTAPELGRQWTREELARWVRLP